MELGILGCWNYEKQIETRRQHEIRSQHGIG